ncbi:MAG: hypothetical protein HOV77_06745 [Hamadaea sp.]|uniref:hypothetical protein n=1 Tax=Hamadaea sp. TaxID=2024425 RepID=UPI0018478DD4|nr:hypothetical protein [Hamadaea sp.]NUT18865.1 hypothetical protein [Hamadaea sp.]
MLYVLLIFAMVYLIAFALTSAIGRVYRVPARDDTPVEAPPISEDEAAELAEGLLTRRLLDGALTQGMYRHALERLASRDEARHPLRM